MVDISFLSSRRDAHPFLSAYNPTFVGAIVVSGVVEAGCFQGTHFVIRHLAFAG
jgi:hypothetical protein